MMNEVRSKARRVSTKLGIGIWLFCLIVSVSILSFAVRGISPFMSQIGLLVPSGTGLTTPTGLAKSSVMTIAGAREAYGKLPLRFESNQGQTSSQVKFMARGSGYTLFLTPTGAVLALSRIHNSEIGVWNEKFMLPMPKSGIQKFSPSNPQSTIHVQKSIVLHMKLMGANPQPQMVGLKELPGNANYFIGNDSKKWQRNIPTYAKVKYKDVYPGIDLVYYGNQKQLEYDFIVAPGVDPKAITFDIRGVDKLEVDARGDLVLHTEGGEIHQYKPLVYQEMGSTKQVISGRYVLKGRHEVGFDVAMYDINKPLVIDPVLSYSTYLGGSGEDTGFGIAVDSSGNAYVTGVTLSPNFPTTTGAFDTTCAPDGSCTLVEDDMVIFVKDAFVTKLDSTGTALVYSTYIGGSDNDSGLGIAVDSSGNAYVTGETSSIDFPTTKGAFQEVKNSGSGFFGSDAFVVKLNPAGNALAYSTYLGGSSQDAGLGIAVDSFRNAYVTGTTLSVDFPTTTGAFQTTFSGGTQGSVDGFNEAFVTKLNSTGTALVYSTYLGGNGVDESSGIAVDSKGNAYVTGNTSSINFPTTAGAFQTTLRGFINAFVTKLNSTGTELVYSTYLGGSSSPFGVRADTEGLSIAVDSTGNAYVTGFTDSFDFPTTPGAFDTTCGTNGFCDNLKSDVFVTKLNNTGTELIYSTYLGGTLDDSANGIAVDTFGNAYVTGITDSSDFPTTPDAFDTTCGTDGSCNFNKGALFNDVFVTKLNSTGSALVYSTYLGGSDDEGGEGIAVDSFGNAYVTGFTMSTDFPTTTGAPQPTFGGTQDAFVTKLNIPHIVNDLVSFEPVKSTFKTTSDTTGCPSGFVGKFSFISKLTDKSTSPPLSDLVIQVANITNGDLLQNADGGPGGVGATLTPPNTSLSPGGSENIPFVICLKQMGKFGFFVHVLGIVQK